MLNLISNAIKFCNPENGVISIKLHDDDKNMQIDVQDNGLWISVEDQKRIFGKFMQVKDTSGGKPHGSGLDLPISSRIVELHGGIIWVESKPGEGSTFSIALPLKME